MHEDRRLNDQNPNPKRRRHTLALLGLELTGLIVAAVAIGLIVGSCGHKMDEVASGASTQPATGAPSASVATFTSPSRAPQSHEGGDVLTPDSLPPEVTASVRDTLVTL